MNFIYTDGKLEPATQNVLVNNNRAFRYGDGLFETIKMINGRIILKNLHFERLFSSLHLLNYQIPDSFTPSFLETAIIELTEKNECSYLCRIRLTLFRGNGNLYPTPPSFNYIIETGSLSPSVNEWNEKGYSIGLYKEAQKSCDRFATIKSANFLPYIMAVMYAEENKMDDCLLLNTKGNIADATIANIFLLNGERILTPALEEGCINGVMRRYLLNTLKGAGYTCLETIITEQDLQNADEVFLTNAINGIRWVKHYKDTSYGSSTGNKIYNEFIKSIFS